MLAVHARMSCTLEQNSSSLLELRSRPPGLQASSSLARRQSAGSALCTSCRCGAAAVKGVLALTKGTTKGLTAAMFSRATHSCYQDDQDGAVHPPWAGGVLSWLVCLRSLEHFLSLPLLTPDSHYPHVRTDCAHKLSNCVMCTCVWHAGLYDPCFGSDRRSFLGCQAAAPSPKVLTIT